MTGVTPGPCLRARNGALRPALALLACALCLAPAAAVPAQPVDEPLRVTVAYSTRSFFQVDTDDARTAARIWIDRTVKSSIPGSEIRTELFDSLEKLEKSVRSGSVDVTGLDPDEFLELSSRLPLEPAFVTAGEEGPYLTILIVVRKDRGARSLADLRGTRFNVSRTAGGSWQPVWLDTVLLRGGFSEAASFFSSVRVVSQPSQALLPVFFGQADACLVTREAFKLAVELNPQIGETLTPLATSPPFVGSIIAFRPGLDRRARERMTKIMSTLGSDPDGRQLLTLFRRSRLVPFQPEYLETTRTLLAEYRTLRERAARRR